MIKGQINEKRSLMINLYNHTQGLLDPELLSLSQELDQLIWIFSKKQLMKKTSCKKINYKHQKDQYLSI